MRCLFLVLALALPTLAEPGASAPRAPGGAEPLLTSMTTAGQLRYTPPSSRVVQLEPIRFYNGLQLAPKERNLGNHPYVQPPMTYPTGNPGGFDTVYYNNAGTLWPVYGSGVGLGIRGGDPELSNW